MFDKLSGIVRKTTIVNKKWKNIKYMVFDLPNNPYIFDVRLQQLKHIIKDINSAHIKLVKQVKISSNDSLIKKLDKIVKEGAEGLMLHKGTSLYKNTHNNNLLKLKKHYDAEAIVIKHISGKGKFSGMLGSMLIEMPSKKRFKIGTGFSNAERRKPPPIGSVITYKYFSLTNKGTPRFASFKRVRNKF